MLKQFLLRKNLCNTILLYTFVKHMEEHLLNIWLEASRTFGSVRMDSGSYIYRGIKFVSRDGVTRMYCTDSEFYVDITPDFLFTNFENGVKRHLKKKYLKKLDKIERSIKDLINNQKNHKRFDYLKKMRNAYLKKYNEINS